MSRAWRLPGGKTPEHLVNQSTNIREKGLQGASTDGEGEGRRRKRGAERLREFRAAIRSRSNFPSKKLKKNHPTGERKKKEKTKNPPKSRRGGRHLYKVGGTEGIERPKGLNGKSTTGLGRT